MNPTIQQVSQRYQKVNIKNEIFKINRYGLRLKNFRYYEDFSIHFGDRVACINTHVVTERDSRPPKEDKDIYFNEYQFFIYNRCLKGLDVYTHWDRKRLIPGYARVIQERHIKCLEVTNLYKQEVLVEKTNHILTSYLERMKAPQNSPIRNALRKEFIENPGTDTEFSCNFTLQELKITKKMLADKLILTGVLPKKFYEITIEDDPRYRRLARETKLD